MKDPQTMTRAEKDKLVFISPCVGFTVILSPPYDSRVEGVDNPVFFKNKPVSGFMATFSLQKIDGELKMAYIPGEDKRLRHDDAFREQMIDILIEMAQNDREYIRLYEKPKDTKVSTEELDELYRIREELKALKSETKKGEAK